MGSSLSLCTYRRSDERAAEDADTVDTGAMSSGCPISSSLPKQMSATTIETVDATAAAVAPNALDITKTFYGGLIEQMPEVILQYFNPAKNVPVSDAQPKALAASVCAYAGNIKDLSPLLVPGGAVDAINHRHCALNIAPAHYPIVHDHLMAAIGKILGSAVTPEVAAAWSEAVLFLAKVMIDKEEALYQAYEARSGGWRGMKDFTVAEIKEVATGVKTFTFQPVEPTDGFEFSEGQYLTLKVDPAGDNLTAPRHYTVTSAPGEKFLECTIKKIGGGKVSTYMHEEVKVGDSVKLMPPYGVFTLDTGFDSAVLMSAGIGVTPMVNFRRALGDKVKLAVHVDKTPEAFAFRSEFESALPPDKLLVKYTQMPPPSRPSAASLAAEAVDKAGTDNIFYICGPEGWMQEVQAELLQLGAKKVMCEVFGSQLATSCPFAASA